MTTDMGDQIVNNQAGDGTKEATESEAVAIDTEQAAEPVVDGVIDRAAIESKLAALISNQLYSLPKPVQRLVKALKNLQVNHVNIEIEFFKELHVLEMKYEKKFDHLYEKRAAIVKAAYEPTDEECEFTCDSDKETELSNELDQVKISEESDKKEAEDIKGIPDFWLTALKNAPAIGDLIEEYDEPILKHLTDIKASTSNNPMSFILEFHFEPNEFFNNTVLTKYYELKCEPDESDVFAFEGPEIVKCKGCPIEWKKGKNVTVKTIKKKQKHKARGAVRTVTKTVQNESFFNFFSPPTPPENEDDMDEETQSVLSNDFEVGNLIKDRIIPHAVLFFTGENLIDEEFDEEDDEDEDEDEYDEDEDEEEEDEENDNQCLNRKKSKGPTGAQTAPPDCKQQ